MYYLDENMMKMSAAEPVAKPVSQPTGGNTEAKSKAVETKTPAESAVNNGSPRLHYRPPTSIRPR